MSQIFTSSLSGPVPPTVATSYVTDSGTAVPAANILNVLGNDTTANDADGIMTTGSGNTVTAVLTNRLQGTGTTVGAVTADLVTFALGATPAGFTFELVLNGFDAAGNQSTSYWHFAAARTSGAAATIIGTDETFQEDAALGGSDVDSIASANNYIVRVTGVAGVTLNWTVVGYYVRST